MTRVSQKFATQTPTTITYTICNIHFIRISEMYSLKLSIFYTY